MANDLSANTKMVLLVDDDPISLNLMQLIIQEAGFNVSLADNGRTALASIEKNAPDIIVTDISMPDMDGLELIRAMRKMKLNIPILALSGMRSNELHLKTANIMGAKAILTKPIDRDQLMHTVRALAGIVSF